MDRRCEVNQSWPLELESHGFGNSDFEAPKGIRIPNGQIWAHALDELYDVRPSKDSPTPVYWSISMIQEFKTAAKRLPDGLTPDQPPGLDDDQTIGAKKPWPLLRYPEEIRCQQTTKTEEESSTYCQNHQSIARRLKSLCLDGDQNADKKLRSGACFCGYSKLPVLKFPRSSVVSSGHCSENHCSYQNRETSIKKSKSLTEIRLGAGTNLEWSNPGLEIGSVGQRTTGCIDMGEILYKPETIPGTELPPKLEEFIPEDLLPDILLVNDSDDCATGKQGQDGHVKPDKPSLEGPRVPLRYHRVLPKTPHKGNLHRRGPQTGYLDLSWSNLHGSGNHSSVYRASFLPPPPLSTNFRSPSGRMTVIAKTAFPIAKDRKHLDNEAEILDKLSDKTHRHMQQEWCGFNVLAGLARPVPVGIVVPKFYGYYKPQPQEESSTELSPILLIEDCGQDIVADELSEDSK
ncbi:hypothetical protein MMC18_005321 [Xylographa bjoerkii]|nr:hypothetical protein [Xylographa bjoerkii]